MMISITDNYSELKHVYIKFFMHSRINLDRVIWKKSDAKQSQECITQAPCMR